MFHLIETIVDLKSVRQWWTHQLYWDQNIRVVEPWAFLGTVMVRAIPFALLFAALRVDVWGVAVVVVAAMIRMATAAGIVGWGFKDRQGLKSLWLLPIRDIAGLVSWALAFTARTVVWRGQEFILYRDGRMAPKP